MKFAVSSHQHARSVSFRSVVLWLSLHSTAGFALGSSRQAYRHHTSLSCLDSKETIDDLLNEITIGKVQSRRSKENNRETPPKNNNGWKTLEWTSQANHTLTPSPMQSILIDDRLISIKRDDLLRLSGSQISGNKARKMFALHHLDTRKFPIDCIVSYGGPQSNAMLAIAAAVRYLNEERSSRGDPPIRFVYYTKTLPKYLRKQSTGNLFRSLALGMELHQVSPVEYNNLFGGVWGGCETPPQQLPAPSSQALWVPQGGACRMAVEGVQRLAKELMAENHMETLTTVVVPGGTCTTAVLLQQSLPSWMQVAVIPCVGTALYAERQMIHLQRQLGYKEYQRLPIILPPHPTDTTIQYPPFGQPRADILATYHDMMEDHGLELDLLYGAPSWTILLRHLRLMKGRRIIYLHTGGLEGIHTQLLRYKYKGLLAMDDMLLQAKKRL